MNASSELNNQQTAQWAELLHRAIAEPAAVSAAYTAFHRYSSSNQLLVFFECLLRGIQPGPIDTFRGWLAKGRHVRKGQRALSMWMPVKARAKDTPAADADGDAGEAATPAARSSRMRYLYAARWFVLAQTDGEPLASVDVAGDWDYRVALNALAITEEPWSSMDGNCHGMAYGRVITINPVAPYQHSVRMHEIAHILLGHTEQGTCEDGPALSRAEREVEAESVALLCCASLQLPGFEDSSGYLQHCLGSHEPIPAATCRRIFQVTDRILRAGRAAEEPIRQEEVATTGA